MSIGKGFKKLLGIPESDENEDVFDDPARETDYPISKPVEPKAPRPHPPVETTGAEEQQKAASVPEVYTHFGAVYEWTGQDGHVYTQFRDSYEHELNEEMGAKASLHLSAQLKEGILRKRFYYCDAKGAPHKPVPETVESVLEEDYQRQQAERKAALEKLHTPQAPTTEMQSPEALIQMLSKMEPERARQYVAKLLGQTNLLALLLQNQSVTPPQSSAPPAPQEQPPAPKDPT